MNSGLNITTPLVVAAFRSALLHQGLIALLIFGTLAVAWVGVREWLPGSSSARTTASRADNAAMAEPAGRKVLRIGFGLLWILDGAGSVDALAVNGTRLADWRLTPSSGWREAQLISVPIQFGSSG